MKSRNSAQDAANTVLGCGCLFWIIIMLIGLVIGGFCWPYVINTWLVYVGKTASVKFWHGMVISIIPSIGPLSLVLAAVTWILMLFLV